ncbi:MAG: mucoidy inhibitor MuiA family protein [bacterium]|nr:mucoidy inhibitor MuiA family protein [bacterium]
MVLKSKVSEVSIYADRALVTRKADITLAPGIHHLIFDKLPKRTRKETVQVKGFGKFLLKDIKFRRKKYSLVPKSRLEALTTEKDAMSITMVELEDKINQAKKEKRFVENIVKRITEGSNKDQPIELNPESWIKMVNFYRSKQESLDKEIRETKIAVKKLEAKINAVNNKKSRIRDKRNLSKLQVELVVRVKQEGRVRLNLSYLVPGPKWYPVYDLHVSSSERTMNIAYKAIILQQTGEDWNGVTVKLSTAEPEIKAQHPYLNPWRLSLKPIPKTKYGFDEGVEGGVEGGVVGGVLGSPGVNMMPAEIKEDDWDKEEMEDEMASVDDAGLSVVFVLKEKSTIKSDNEKHKVTIIGKTFPAHFRYSTIPKLKPLVFLKVKVKNKTNYPFLPGKASVFLDNGFVSSTTLQHASPGQEFWTFLKADKAIKVDYKFLKKFRKEKGKKVTITYESRFIVENNKETEEELVLWDQVPISGDKGIKVKFIEPVMEAGAKAKEEGSNNRIVRRNEYNYLEWFYKLKPGEKKTIPFKFSVEYPKEREIIGL